MLISQERKSTYLDLEILSRELDALLRLLSEEPDGRPRLVSEEDRELACSRLREPRCDLKTADRPYIHSIKTRQASPADKTLYRVSVSIIICKVD